MGWLGLWHPGGSWFQDCRPDHGPQQENALLVRGSLVIETRLTASARPEPLLMFEQGGSWPLKLVLQAVPGGGLTLVLEQAGQVLHRTLNLSGTGRTGLLRLTYSWDAPQRWGRLALERPEDGLVLDTPLPAPAPWRLGDLQALLQPGPFRYTAPEVEYAAVSDQVEPLGPMPSLDPRTPVAVPQGFCAAGSLRRGDLVITSERETVPVLQAVRRTVPAFGSFCPVRLRAPYFSLLQDISVAGFQRMLISGSEVEYLFGQEAVLVPARHLTATRTAYAETGGPLFTDYVQAVLPDQQGLTAAGTALESLHIGRLRRNPERLSASLLARAGRDTLPEHGVTKYPVLRAFDATVLAERRVA
jgi:hypothetical protein